MVYDIIIIGGGIIGLATALKLKENKENLKILVLEKENSVAQHQTGNNSGVIHAGVYYKPGSLKALNCRKGYQMLLDFCIKEGINYDICGKLIIATSKDELPGLENLYKRSLENGLEKVKKVSGSQIKEYEPYATGLAALYVPYTAIINYNNVCSKFVQIFTEKYEGKIHLNNKVINIITNSKRATVITNKRSYDTKLVVNTAGLFSDKIALLTQKKLNVKIIPFRGEYSVIKKEREYLVKNLIYPVPDLKFPFLGVHFTRMIEGGIEVGPNAVWAFKREGYKKSDFNFNDFFEALAWPGFRKVMMQYWKMGMGEYYRSNNKNALMKALQRLIPEIKKDDLIKGSTGVRAQACDKKGGLIDDFLIIENKNTLDVLNAPSPAATASLSIGQTLSEKIIKKIT
jgi:L-2-hydroxyglutarate oxidase